ncbi:PIR protein CIR protein, fragment [Plasmodium vinckei petteri]|uniref:PIR protein CIR protein n=1 Tax=Plasmodium vinckei petteri TaxID=138298 RepID=A0A6V7TAC7_PLAVN|nr:PIR protein CIR protein, fragment [Plasmodium vinckei petteri]
MKAKELCENFIAADKIINGEIEGNLTLEKLSMIPKFKEYCPNNKCETYMKLNDDIEKFIINSTECYNQYSSLYNSVPKCNSYLHLLDNLKKTYEGFKNSVHEEIKNNIQI